MFPKKEPRKEDQSQKWDLEAVNPGSWFNGWIAGEMIGVLCHWNYRSIPCYHELTDGQLPCPNCPTRPALHWNGYLPLYRDTYRPTVVVIREVSRHAVEKLRVHDAVRIGREEKRGSAITVTPSKWANRFVPPKDFKGVPDIRRWLLRLWKEKELEQWVLAHPYTDRAEQLRDTPARPDPGELAVPEEFEDKGLAQMRRLLDKEKRHHERNQLPPTIGDVLPMSNGVHKKKS